MTNDQLTHDLEERIREAFRGVPFAHHLGIELGEMRSGEASLHLEVRDELRRNNGFVHGGVIASLADTAAAFAILTTLGTEETTTTVDMTIHYMRPLTRGKATARARVVRAGRRVITIHVDVLDEAGRLSSTALATFIKLA
ncbi:MAG: PaaI family thioesterase [Acidobacteriota bacterium]|nr:PaaI family thioesterase [Acidobacteriota bacterium]